MKNILSYINPVFTGEEISEWVNYQIQNGTSHIKTALWLKNHFIIHPERQYKLYWQLEHAGIPKTKKPYLFRYKEKI